MAASASSVDVYRSATEMPADVQALLAKHEVATLQFGLAWWQNLEAQVFANHPGCRYFVLRSHGVATAVLPLLVNGGAMYRRAQALGNYYTCLYEPALALGVDAPSLSQLFAAVRRYEGGVHSMTLAPMNPEGASFAVVERALALAKFNSKRYFCFGNWYLEPPASWNEYLASREGKLRSTIKRMKQRVANDEGVVEIITGGEDLERGIAAYETVYANSWKVPEPSPGFMPGLMRLCAERGAMRLGLVWLKGKPVAAQFWIVANGRAEIYKVAYDEAYKSHSPGTVLTAHLLQHVLEQDGVREVDYLIGDDAYKKNWMSRRRERWGLEAYNTRTATGLGLLAVAGLKGLAKVMLSGLKAMKAKRKASAKAPS